MESDSGGWQGPTLSAWFYDSPRGAVAGRVRLAALVRRGAVVVVDVVTATWVGGAHRPLVGNPHDGAAFRERWTPLELLLRLLLVDPRASDEEVGCLARELDDTGLTEDFLRRLREGLVPGSSALVVLSQAADVDAVQHVIELGRARGDVRMIHAPLDVHGLRALEDFAHRRAESDRGLG
jgi:uncharacterized membrane protein